MRKVDLPCPICGEASAFSVRCPDTLGDREPVFDYSFRPEHFLTFRIVRCERCSHCFASPRPENLFANYVDTVDDAYVRDSAQYLLTFRKVLDRLLRFRHEGRLLDVGCSTGLFLDVARDHFAAEGLELSTWASERARAKGHAVHGDQLSSLDPEEPYDVVTMWGVIEHFEDPAAELRQISRLLKPGGLVCLWTGDVDSITSRLLGRKWWYYQGQHIQMFTERSLSRLFEAQGFELLDMSMHPYVMSLASVLKSLGRYRALHRIARPLLQSRLLRERKITIRLPGEMSAVFVKRG